MYTYNTSVLSWSLVYKILCWICCIQRFFQLHYMYIKSTHMNLQSPCCNQMNMWCHNHSVLNHDTKKEKAAFADKDTCSCQINAWILYLVIEAFCWSTCFKLTIRDYQLASMAYITNIATFTLQHNDNVGIYKTTIKWLGRQFSRSGSDVLALAKWYKESRC